MEPIKIDQAVFTEQLYQNIHTLNKVKSKFDITQTFPPLSAPRSNAIPSSVDPLVADLPFTIVNPAARINPPKRAI